MLGADQALLVEHVAADHAGRGGHGGLRLRQQRLHQRRVLARQVMRLLNMCHRERWESNGTTFEDRLINKDRVRYSVSFLHLAASGDDLPY